MKELYFHIWLPVNMANEPKGLTIMCFCSHEPFSSRQISHLYGAMETSMPVVFNLNRSTTVLLIASKDEKECSDQMEGLRSLQPFHRVLETLVSFHFCNPLRESVFEISLGNIDSTESPGLFLAGTVSSLRTMVGN